MTTFTYKGTTANGIEVEETIEAADRYTVYDHARGLGHTIVSLSAKAPARSLRHVFSMERINMFLSHVKQDEIVVFSRNLAAMLRAGLALTRALTVSERQTKNLAFKRMLGGIREDVQKGKQFHESLKPYPKAFSRLYIAMVRAGEEGGTLVEALQTISLQLEQTSNLRKKIRGAMIYPAIVIIAMFAIGVLMMIFVVPTLTSTFRELKIELPLATRVIVGISDFLSQHTIFALVAVVAIVVGAFAFYRTHVGRVAVEWTLLRLPILSTLVKETNTARTARTLSPLLHSGVEIVSALSITEDVMQNTFYKAVIHDATAHVEKGKPMSEDFIKNEQLYPALAGEMIAVGEETGQVAQMLEEVATFYESEVERKTKDLSTIIEPILMIVIGAAVGLFALAMIMPIYSISDSIV